MAGFWRKAARTTATTLAALVLVGAAVGAHAVAQDKGQNTGQDAGDAFYRGKTIRILIGYGAGGGYDLYGRVAAEFLGRYLPGAPTVVPQNMPGAGSLVAARYLNGVAAADGTTLGALVQSLPLDVAVGNAPGIDLARMRYIGRLTSNTDIGIGREGATLTMDDARAREITVAATTGASPAVVLPMALNLYGGAKFKLVRGYRGVAESLLAVERGEADVAGSGGLAGLLVSHPAWILERKAPVLYQAGLTRHPLLPHVPTIEELALTPEGKQIMRAIAGTADIGRSIIAGPGAPDARIAQLRAAFDTMVKDPAFLAEMRKRNVTIEAASGAQMDAVAKEALAMPKDVLAKVAELLK